MTTALVTGASSGIGRELARAFAAAGHSVVLVARRQGALEGLAEELRGQWQREVLVVPFDLAEPDAARRLFVEVSAAGIEVDILANSAGVLEIGAFLDLDEERLNEIISINVLALASLTRRFAKAMVTRGYGEILNMSSVAGFYPVPSMALYAATKAFIISLGESLAEELQGTGVTVTTLCPGPTKTEMLADLIRERPQLEAVLPFFAFSDPAEIARQGVEAATRGEVLRIPGMANRVAAEWARYQPRAFVRMMNGLLGRAALANLSAPRH